MNLTVALAKSADLAGEGARGGGEPGAVRKRRTSDRSESRFQWPLLLRTFERERKRECWGGPRRNAEGSMSRRKTINPFFASPSFHLSGPSTLSRSRLHGSSTPSRFRFLGNWSVRCRLRHRFRQSIPDNEYDSTKSLSLSLSLPISNSLFTHSLVSSLNRRN